MFLIIHIESIANYIGSINSLFYFNNYNRLHVDPRFKTLVGHQRKEA